MTVGFRYEKRTFLLRVHHAKQLPPTTLHRHDQQPPQPHLPAQNQRVPRVHLRLRRRPPGLLGKLRRCPQSHSPRKETEKLEKRKETMADSPSKSKIQRPIRRLVRQRRCKSARSLNHSSSFKPLSPPPQLCVYYPTPYTHSNTMCITPTLCIHPNPVIPTEGDQAKRRSTQWRDLVFPISKVDERVYGVVRWVFFSAPRSRSHPRPASAAKVPRNWRREKTLADRQNHHHSIIHKTSPTTPTLSSRPKQIKRSADPRSGGTLCSQSVK